MLPDGSVTTKVNVKVPGSHRCNGYDPRAAERQTGGQRSRTNRTRERSCHTGGVAVVIAGFVAILSVNGALAVARLPSVTCTVKFAAPAAVGLPLI